MMPRPSLPRGTPGGAWGRGRASATVGDTPAAVCRARVAGFYPSAAPRGTGDSTPAGALPVPSPPRGIPRPVSGEDLAAALACADERVRPWLVLAGWAGFRAKEIALLRRESVLDTAVPPWLLGARNATKGRRDRRVPASPFGLAELRIAGLPRSGWMFPRRDGKPGPCTPALISGLAGRCFREAGSAATLHMARHRFASQLYQQTRDIRLVQEMLGHPSPATTAVYADYGDGAVEAVGSLPFPPRLRAAG